MTVLIENQRIDNIPILIVYKEEAQNCPVVFFVHGFTSKKEKDLNIGYELAARDIVTVHIDARQHGERLSPELASADEELKAKLFFDIVTGTSQDVSRIITHFENDRRVNINRLGVAGISMGGFITYHIITMDNRIKAAAPLIGTPAWEDFILFNKDNLNDINPEPMIKQIKNIDPISNYNNIYPCALLMQNGKLDSLVPYNGVEKLYELLYPLYKQNHGNLEYHIYNDVNHDVTEIMRQKLYDFFLNHL